jgi:hypothetical protein
VYQNKNQWYCVGSENRIQKQKTTRLYRSHGKQQTEEFEILFLLIDITQSIETSGVEKIIEYLETVNSKVLIKYLSFGDEIFYDVDSKFKTKSQIITELQSFIDNYDGTYTLNTFWNDEGTDLPENGIDALYTALTNIDTKYKNSKKTFYLVTDNNEFSRNINDAIDVYNLFLNTSKSKLYFDIIESTKTNKLVWDNEEYIIQNHLDFEYAIYITGSQKRPRWFRNISGEGWALDGRTFYRKIYYNNFFSETTNFVYKWKYADTGNNSITSYTEGWDISAIDFSPSALIPENISVGSTYTSYPLPPTGWANEDEQPVDAFIPDLNNAWISLRDGATFLEFNLNDYSSVELIKVQDIPKVEPEKGNYNEVFPPTENKIIYL